MLLVLLYYGRCRCDVHIGVGYCNVVDCNCVVVLFVGDIVGVGVVNVVYYDVYVYIVNICVVIYDVGVHVRGVMVACVVVDVVVVVVVVVHVLGAVTCYDVAIVISDVYFVVIVVAFLFGVSVAIVVQCLLLRLLCCSWRRCCWLWLCI